jgi:MFS family permease
MAALAGGLYVLMAVGPDSSFAQIVLSLMLTGIGMGFSFPGLVSSIANSVEEKDFGATSAAQEMLMMVGMTLGMQGLQTIQSVRQPVSGLAGSYQDAFLVGAVIATVAALLAFTVRSMHRAQPVPPTESPETPYVPERVT